MTDQADELMRRIKALDDEIYEAKQSAYARMTNIRDKAYEDQKTEAIKLRDLIGPKEREVAALKEAVLAPIIARITQPTVSTELQ